MTFAALLQVVIVAHALIPLAEAQAPLDVNLLVNQLPLVFAHNAATGYLNVSDDLADLAQFGYVKNQVGSFTDQLICGARALDLEFMLVESVLMFGHGGVGITEIGVLDGIQEILDWANLSPLELILLSIGICSGCDSSLATIFQSLDVEFITNCSIFQNLTVEAALNLGPVLAADAACFVQNYNETLACHGFLPSSDPDAVAAIQACVPDPDTLLGSDSATLIQLFSNVFTCLSTTLTPDLVDVFDCWANSGTEDYPITQLFEYLNITAYTGPPESGWPWLLQALWQTNEDSALLGLFRPFPLPETLFQLTPSSILQDVASSEINRLVLEFVIQLVQNNVTLNLVGVDNVCDEYGSQLLSVLRSTGNLTTTQPDTTSPTTTMPPETTEPTTMSPSTSAPTTIEPTTMSPSTSPPTTMEPTTMSLSTSAPTMMQSPSSIAHATAGMTVAIVTVVSSCASLLF